MPKTVRPHIASIRSRFPGKAPQASEADEPSPFVRYQLRVMFLHREGQRRFDVNGFFAADGNAAETSATSGNVWSVRFAPPLPGIWEYQATLTDGETEVPLPDARGSFEVTDVPLVTRDLRTQGFLEYVGQRYLRFSGSKKYFLKAGVDSPETFLGYAEFDGTWHDRESHQTLGKQPPIELPSLENGLHRYLPHADEWKDSDPSWQSGKGKSIVGGLNYLADQSINSVYFLTMNVIGDGRNVWPWTGPTEFERFDVSKLEQWNIVFEHMQRLGIQMHVVLQEMENDHLLDDGELGKHRKLYLKELVARFGHHPALIWNLGEENLQTSTQQLAMSEYLRSCDPYDHPIVLHNDHWSAASVRQDYQPLLGTNAIDGIAMQDFLWADVHSNVRHYINASRDSGKPWFVCSDEMGGEDFGLLTDAQDPTHDIPRAYGLWGNLMAGGAGVEWYFGWQNNSPDSDLSAETWGPRQEMWRQTKLAIDFFHRHLPFSEMESHDELTLASDDYCFAKPGSVYCVYQPRKGSTRIWIDDEQCYSIDWFDPLAGGELSIGTQPVVWGTGWVEIGLPPDSMQSDCVALIRKISPVFIPRADGAIVVEAEHHQGQTRSEPRAWHRIHKGGDLPELEGAGELRTWVSSYDSASANASGRTLLRILPDTRRTHADKLIHGENFSPEPGKMAVLSYSIQFDAPGRYYVWVRAFSTGSEDNGLHVGIDGKWPEHGKRMQWCKGKNQWTWGCAQRTEQQHCGVPMEIYLDVEEVGVHRIEFSMREDGFAFDQFLLTKDRDYRPRGQESGERITP